MFAYYIMPILFFALQGVLFSGAILALMKKAPLLSKIFLTIGVSGDVAVFGFFTLVMLQLMGLIDNFFTLVLALLIGLILVSYLAHLWGLLRKKFLWIPLVCLSGVLIVGSGGHLGYHAWLDSIPTLDENAELLPAWAPYGENTKAVALEEAATLQLTENLPCMDGATALFPVYSSFARAVYPKDVLEHWSDAYNDPTLLCTKTNGAYDNLIAGGVDIIFVSGPSVQQEEMAKECGVELVYTPIGKEAFVFFVNAKNPLTEITTDQIKGIYSGEITQWSALGVEGLGRIRAFQRPENSGSQTNLQKLMGDTPLMTPPTKDVVSGMGGIIKEAADYKNHKNAIGYSFRFYSTEMVQNNMIRHLSVNGVAPTLENIENGTYPLGGTFYAVTRSDADENTKKFVEWITGPQGQAIIEQVGYTPLQP
ncbi:MAG: substrate-binding domain-containing protein [Clostridia bacterium]|nr:substrate-binding domain-containing protein [Clostridia bacterium]